MAHLYLPVEHTDADLVLAGQIAESIDSAELYVAWTPSSAARVPRGRGPSCAPPEPREAEPSSPAAVRELWAAVRHRPAEGPRAPEARRRAARAAA